jgi:predicted NBD/HSP70 family sugar kinase
MSAFLTVTIGRGVGLGIVIGGAVYRGHGGGAGEFGHVTAVEDGDRCTCGKHGCLETLAADPALVAAARAAGLLSATEGIDALRRHAADGNEGVLALYRRAGHALGRALSDLVNVFSPELVLLSGEGILAWAFLAEAVENSFRSGLFPPLAGVALEIDPWDDAKWARGAASLVLRPTFVPSRADGAGAQSVRERLTSASRAKKAVA